MARSQPRAAGLTGRNLDPETTLDLDALADMLRHAVPGAERAGISVRDTHGVRHVGTAGAVSAPERAALTRPGEGCPPRPGITVRRVSVRAGSAAEVLVAVAGATTTQDEARLDAVVELLRGWLAEGEAQAAVTHLEQALEHARLLGRAVGLVMAQRHLTTDQAVAYLRSLSNGTNTRLRDIAADLLHTHEEHVTHGHDIPA